MSDNIVQLNTELIHNAAANHIVLLKRLLRSGLSPVFQQVYQKHAALE